jgi:hypothetical protein
VSLLTPKSEASDPAWDAIVKVALEAYAARKGGGPAVAAQVQDSIRWSMERRTPEDALYRLAQLNEALLLIGSAAIDVAVRQINAPAKGLDAPMGYLDLLELIGEVLRNPASPREGS